MSGEVVNSVENSNENLNKIGSNDDSNEPPPPPNLVSTAHQANGTTHVPTPLLISSASISSSSSSSASEHNGLNSNINNSIGCVKKRVWTPIQTNSSINNLKNDLINNSLIGPSPSLSEVI